MEHFIVSKLNVLCDEAFNEPHHRLVVDDYSMHGRHLQRREGGTAGVFATRGEHAVVIRTRNTYSSKILEYISYRFWCV